jgi:hypothetical protein
MSFKFDINHRFYKLVSASTSETLDYTPANNEKIVIVNAGGDCSNTPDTNICIVWDPGGAQQEIILSTYRDAKHENIGKEFTGDGTRVLRINLVNDLGEATYLGGFVQAERL